MCYCLFMDDGCYYSESIYSIHEFNLLGIWMSFLNLLGSII